MTTRDFKDLSPFECVLAAADRYEVEVVLLPTLGTWRRPRGASQGPAGHFVDVDKRRVYLESSILDPLSVASELHEVVHCIVAPPRPLRRVFAEHHGLLQLETALARVLFRHCRSQIDDVRAYQGITFLDDTHRVGDWPHHERTAWWRLGTALMHELGFLADGKPTWRRGTWPDATVLRAHAARVRSRVGGERERGGR